MPLTLGFDARTPEDREKLKQVQEALKRHRIGAYLCDGGTSWREWHDAAEKLSSKEGVDIEEALDRVLDVVFDIEESEGASALLDKLLDPE